MKQQKAAALQADARGAAPAGSAVAAVAAQAAAHAARLRATARAAQLRVTARAARFRGTAAAGPVKAGAPLEAVTPLRDDNSTVPLEPVVPLRADSTATPLDSVAPVPGEGAAPLEPVRPLKPAGPLDPAAPTGGDNSAAPLEPVVPLRAESSATPLDPVAPARADSIAAPLKPAGPDALAALRRIRASGPAARPEAPVVVERCELCAVPVGPEHRHVVNLDSRALLCACRPCSLLFEHPEAELAYRTVPDRHVALPPLPRQQWDSLDVPVGLAFVFRNSRQARTVVCYPGPAGATEADLPIDASEAFGEAVPDVEAVLIRAREDGFDRFVVPIDACYALVGHLRTLWRGFDGGPEAHARVEEFFADIERKAVRPA